MVENGQNKLMRASKCIYVFFLTMLLSACNHGIPPQTDLEMDKQRPFTKEDPASISLMKPTTPLPQKPLRDFPYLRGINIGNALEAPEPGSWGVTIREEYFDEINKAGFNSVRLPVRFSAHIGSAPKYKIEADFLKLIDNNIQVALSNNLIIILDVHHFTELMENPEKEKEKFLSIWRQLSEHYQYAPPQLFFDLLNEPEKSLDSKRWNEMVSEVIPIIRMTNPTRKIIVGGVDYSTINSLELLQLPADDNLIAAFHFYSPFEFTHQGADWVQGSDLWQNTTWTGTTAEKEIIQKDLDLALSWSIQNNIPVVMSEFGVIKKADNLSRLRWIQYLTQEASRRDIGWVYWDFCAEFGIYNCESQTWDRELLSALLSNQQLE